MPALKVHAAALDKAQHIGPDHVHTNSDLDTVNLSRGSPSDCAAWCWYSKHWRFLLEQLGSGRTCRQRPRNQRVRRQRFASVMFGTADLHRFTLRAELGLDLSLDCAFIHADVSAGASHQFTVHFTRPELACVGGLVVGLLGLSRLFVCVL